MIDAFIAQLLPGEIALSRIALATNLPIGNFPAGVGLRDSSLAQVLPAGALCGNVFAPGDRGLLRLQRSLAGAGGHAQQVVLLAQALRREIMLQALPIL